MNKKAIGFDDIISNNEELLNEYIFERISELYGDIIRTDKVVELANKQTKLEEKLSNIIKVLGEDGVKIFGDYQDSIAEYYSEIQEQYYILGMKDIIKFLVWSLK